MTGNQLAARRPYTLTEVQSIGEMFVRSGYFKDAGDVAKAAAKVLAGQELGLGPWQAMSGIHIVQGKPTLSSSLVGALIKRSGRYDYRVKDLTPESCTLVFYEHGEAVGVSTFTIAEARAAGLANKDVWKHFPRNMLMARALTNGARWFCPDVFGGAVYTPEELGLDVDGETGEMSAPPPDPAGDVVDAEAIEVGGRAPWTDDPEKVAAAKESLATAQTAFRPPAASKKQVDVVKALVAQLVQADETVTKSAIASSVGRAHLVTSDGEHEHGSPAWEDLSAPEADELIGKLRRRLERTKAPAGGEAA